MICDFTSFATEHVNSLIPVITGCGVWRESVQREGSEGSKPYSDLRLSIFIFMESLFRCLDTHNSINESQTQDEK